MASTGESPRTHHRSQAAAPAPCVTITMTGRKTAAVALAAMLLAASGVVGLRRAFGAFDQPPPLDFVLAAAGLAIAGGEIAWRLADRENVATRRRVTLAMAATMWLLAAGLTAPAGATPGQTNISLAIWGFVAAIATFVAWSRLERLDALSRNSPIRLVASPEAPSVGPSFAMLAAAEALLANRGPIAAEHLASESSLTDDSFLADDAPLADDIVQQLTRREEPDGVHWVSGRVRVRFDTGQRVAHAHVAFCPPFLATPSCEVETIAGPDADVKISQLLPHGARFETRLDVAAAEPSEVVIEFASGGPAR